MYIHTYTRCIYVLTYVYVIVIETENSLIMVNKSYMPIVLLSLIVIEVKVNNNFLKFSKMYIVQNHMNHI